jgi:hypothetical protein
MGLIKPEKIAVQASIWLSSRQITDWCEVNQVSLKKIREKHFKRGYHYIEIGRGSGKKVRYFYHKWRVDEALADLGVKIKGYAN